MKVKIHVTQEDIDRGMRLIPGYCPIALAIKREVAKCIVGASCAVVFAETHFRTDLPRSAQCLIKRFDRGQEVKPFNFILDVPEDE